MSEAELRIEYLSVDKLKPYDRNARKHKVEDISAIKASIEEFGFDDPIGIWGDKNIIVEGHGRLMAAKELGMSQVPVIRLDHLTDEQRKAYALAHNKTAELSEWDFDLLGGELDGILDIDMSQFGFTVEDEPTPDTAQEDDFDPMPPAEPKSKPGQVYKLGEHVLMCGDSTREGDVAKLMGDAMADLVVTDPPYNVKYGTQSCQTNKNGVIQNDNMSSDEFYHFCCDAFSNMDNHLKDGGAFYIWYANIMTLQVYSALTDIGLKPRAPLTWVKDRMVLDFNDYHTQIEPCLYSWKGTNHYFTEDRTNKTLLRDDTPDISKLKKEELIEIVKSVYDFTDAIHEDRPQKSDLHPTMKPIKLLARLIHNSSRPGEIVLDLFGGSGSTLIACEQLNRRCYMMEYEPQYVDVIIDRWEQFTGQKAELIQDV